MKREPGIPLWYCAHGLPKGFEAQVLRARGLVPLQASKTYTRMLELAGYAAETGHDERGDSWLWAPALLARLIPCGVELRHRVFMCTRLAPLDLAERAELLIELDATVRLAGANRGESAFNAVLGRCPTVEQMHEAWRRIYPLGERGSVYR